MVKLGMKISKAFKSLGDKSTKAFNTLGSKTNDVIKQTKQIAGRVDDVARNAIDKTRDIVNKIPDVNEKAIKLGQTVIKKSGGITDVLRKGANIGDKLISGVASLGGDIPVVGNALKVASKATHQLNVGAKKLDQARDTGAKKLNKYSTVSRETIGDIEKMNNRKKEEIMSSLTEPTDNFA